MNPSQEQIYTFRVTRKARAGGSSCLALACFLVGLCLLFPFWPLGLILIAIGFAVDVKTKQISTCGYCGNEVAHSSVLCPTCRADLAPPTAAMRTKDTLKQVAKTTAILLVITAVVIAVVISRQGQ